MIEAANQKRLKYQSRSRVVNNADAAELRFVCAIERIVVSKEGRSNLQWFPKWMQCGQAR